MAVAGTISTTTPGGDVDPGGKFLYVFGSVTFSGSYTTGGDTFDLTALTFPTGYPAAVPFNSLPTQITFASANGYNYAYVTGTSRANGKIKISTASNTQLANGAYPAGITGDTVTFNAVFPKEF